MKRFFISERIIIGGRCVETLLSIVRIVAVAVLPVSVRTLAAVVTAVTIAAVAAASVIAAVTAVFLFRLSREAYTVNRHIIPSSGISVSVLILLCLHFTVKHNHTALAEILADEFCGASPSGCIEEIDLIFLVLAVKSAVYRNAKSCVRNTVLRGFEFGGRNRTLRSRHQKRGTDAAQPSDGGATSLPISVILLYIM